MYSSVSQLFTYTFSSPGRLLLVTRLALALTLVFFAVKPSARALLPPPAPDGGYPSGNTAEGTNALFSLTNGVANTAVGSSALKSITEGDSNTATGALALADNTTGSDNTATGYQALSNNINGAHNTANGTSALFSNTTGDNNTANGYWALINNTSGNSNTAGGYQALLSNTSGGFNTATGFHALFSNRGSFNTANGADALSRNTTAFFNTAMGVQALFTNTTGGGNAATGYQALYFNQTGGQNTANGVQALFRTTGGSNIALGFQAGLNLTTGDNNIDIGNAGVAAESGKIRIGTQGTHNGTFIAGISGVVVAGPHVVVSANGKLGVAASSARFKKAIKPMDHASQAIHRLEPVTFRYKEEIDPNGIPQFGLVAEQVEKVNPDLVIRDDEGKIMSVRYEAVNAMLLNEFQIGRAHV